MTPERHLKRDDKKKNGVAKRSSNYVKDTVVLRLADIFDSRLLNTPKRKIKLTDKEIEKYALQRNDILITRVNGSPKIVGSFTRYDRDDEWTFCDHFIRLKLNSAFLMEEYLSLVAKTKDTRNHINWNMVSSAGQNTISQKTIKNIPVPLPPKQEQFEIVKRVESLLKIAELIESRYDKARGYVDNLTQSILAKAFKGELVPQDPNDEPSSELLERIKAAREKAEPNQRNKKNTKMLKGEHPGFLR